MKTIPALLLLFLTACASIDRSAQLQPGMTRSEVIATMGKQPDATHYQQGIEILEFDYHHPVNIGGNWTSYTRKFPVYLQDGRAVQWGDDPHRANYTMEHRFTGGTTNEYRSTKK